MVLLFLSLVSCTLLLWLYVRWSKVKRFWADKGVPHYPPHPIMGSLTFLQRQNPALWMRQVYKDFKSPYVGMWLFWRPGLIINSPEIARKVLVKDADNFRNRFASSGKSDPIGSLNLFTVKDPTWTKIRRRLTLVFTAAKMKNQSEITQVKARDLVQRFKEEIANNKSFNIRTICSDYSTDVIGESAFGISSESAKTGDSVIRRVTRELTKFNFQRGLSWSSIFFFPELVDIFRFTFFPKDTVENIRHIYRSVIEQRGGYDREIKETKDLLDALLKLRQEAVAENEEMSEDLLLAQAAILLFGGFETTGATMTWIIYELAWHPQYQQKLYEELLQAKEEHGDKVYDVNVLTELTYLTCVIKETLRLFPPMGWLDRIATKDYQIDDNVTIPAGTVIYVNAVSTQVDPEYFPDPMVFKPDRFLPENETNMKPYTYMPFGEGPRVCIGQRFAYQTIRQGISSIILNYEVRALPDTPKPNDVQVEKNGVLLMPLDDKMKVEFVPRNEV